MTLSLDAIDRIQACRGPGHARNRLAIPGLTTPRSSAGFARAEVGADGTMRPFTVRLQTEYPAIVKIAGVVVREVIPAAVGQFPDWLCWIDSHDRTTTKSVRGRIDNFNREGSTWTGRVTSSNADEESRALYAKVASRCISAASLGYFTDGHEIAMPGESVMVAGRRYSAIDDLPLLVAKRWVAIEGSAVVAGADPLCHVLDFDSTSGAAGVRIGYDRSGTPLRLSDGLPTAGRRYRTEQRGGLCFHDPIQGHFR